MTVKELVTNFVHGAVIGHASSASIKWDKDEDITFLYSYSTVIAKKDKDNIVINMNNYSVTTSKLQNWLLKEATNYGLNIAIHEIL